MELFTFVEMGGEMEQLEFECLDEDAYEEDITNNVQKMPSVLSHIMSTASVPNFTLALLCHSG